MACDMSLAYVKNMSSPKIDPWDTLQDTDAGWEKLFPKSTKNDLLDKSDLNQFTETDTLRETDTHFS